MFTGLVEQCGTVLTQEHHAKGTRLVIAALFEQLVLGESIAVNGVCLTLISHENGHVAFDVSPETLRVTSLGGLTIGSQVHLERALRVSDRLGGHYVNGHVDRTAEVTRVASVGDYVEMDISGFTPEDKPYLCPKGSVTLDGVSLTINAVHEGRLTIMLVPHTLLKTHLSDWVVGQRVNVEFDYVARVVVHQLGSLSDSTIMSLFTSPKEGIEVLV
jgi:riboflavin synthase